MNSTELAAQLASLNTTIEMLTKRVVESDQSRQEAERRAQESRGRLYEKVEELGKDFHGIQIVTARMESQLNAQAAELKSFSKEVNAKLRTLEVEAERARDDIDMIKPKVDRFTKWEQRGVGIGLTLTALGTVFGVFLATFRERFLKMFI